MNGAEQLIRTLVAGGIKVCFANPGTSEMHFCAALDRVEGLECVLGLFEGVVTGAADGYARMKDEPAATLLHTGPGLANGLSNIHNARKAHTPMVNVIGEHATYHIEHDAPLNADIEGIARPMSDWVMTARVSSEIATTTAQAIAESQRAPGCIASLILPADAAWQDAGEFKKAPPIPAITAPKKVAGKALEKCARVIREEEDVLILLGGKTLRESSLEWAGKLASHCDVGLITEFATARTQRGAGRVHVPRMPYVVDVALEATKRFKHAILVNTKSPVAFFAYPNKPSLLLAKDCQIHTLATVAEDGPQALIELAVMLGAENAEIQRQSPDLPKMPSGKLDSDTISAVVANVLPEGVIVSDESISMGRNLLDFTKGCPPHDWLFITGGSIGQGMPLATGAAVACRDRPVLSLSGDGSAMYTLQSLWTQAREQLNVTTVIYANRSYAILHGELRNVGAQPGKNTRRLFDLENPNLNWVEMACGMGVEGVRVETAEELHRAMSHGLSTPGPYLIEAIC